MGIVMKNRFRRPQQDELRYQKADIFKVTGLRADFDRLTDEEAVKLRALVIDARQAATAEGIEGCDPSKLDRQSRKAFERLVEKAADAPGWFAGQREQAKREREQQQKARKPSRQQRWEQPGTIVIPATILSGLQQGGVGAVHLLVLTVVLAAVENKCALNRFMRYDADGSIVVDVVENLIRPLDPEGDVSHVGLAVQELADAGLLIVERQGFVRVRLGSLLADALAERRAA
jgi:hypothetical protein